MKNSEGTCRDCRKRTGNKVSHWHVIMCCAVSWNAEKNLHYTVTDLYIHGNNLIPVSVPPYLLVM